MEKTCKFFSETGRGVRSRFLCIIAIVSTILNYIPQQWSPTGLSKLSDSVDLPSESEKK